MSKQRHISIRTERDVLVAASAGATMAKEAGFSVSDCARVETSVSELARNLMVHAHGGTLILTLVSQAHRTGLKVSSMDSGPGIANISQALQDGFTTKNSLGIGLGVAKRMMDDFSICSYPGWGTHIIAVKWNR